MDMDRRQALKTGGGATFLALLAAAGWIPSAYADAPGWNKAAFETKTMDETLEALGAGKPAQSRTSRSSRRRTSPRTARWCRSASRARIPKTESIAILIEKNPNMLAAVFDFRAGTDPAITTRVKMAQTSNVYALVKADGKYYVASKEIKVTLGGCGG